MTHEKNVEYVRKFDILYDTSLKGKPGIDRYSTITAFNEFFYKYREPDPSPLSDIRYIGHINTSNIDIGGGPFAREVAETLANTEWYTKFGLSYLDTMQLTYTEWCILKRTLSIDQPKHEGSE